MALTNQQKKRTLKERDTRWFLHRLWTKAVGTPSYNKGEWFELESRIEAAKALEATGPGDREIRLKCMEFATSIENSTPEQLADAADVIYSWITQTPVWDLDYDEPEEVRAGLGLERQEV